MNEWNPANMVKAVEEKNKQIMVDKIDQKL
jgi:hypothetical protein